MKSIFSEPITCLPQADIPLRGVTAYLSQGENHQIIFMEFAEDVDLPEHAHAAQVGLVLEGRIDLMIGGTAHTFMKGDRYTIPADTVHSGHIYAGYADMTFFDQKDRYGVKMG